MAQQQQTPDLESGAGSVIPLVHPISTRDGTLGKDSKLVNALVERSEQGLMAVKRPGMTLQQQLSAATAQGLCEIAGSGYAILANALRRVDGGATLAIPGAGAVTQHFTSLPNLSTGTTLLQSTDGLWQTNGSTITKVTDADYPAATLPGICELDGTYYVMASSDGTIRGSAVQDPFTWDALNFIGPGTSLGAGVAVQRHLNYIVGFYDRGVQMFYDAANPTGSPLAPADSASWLTGCAHAQSVALVADCTLFMGKDKFLSRSIQMLNGVQMVQVSDPYIEKILNRASLTGLRAFALRTAGHSLYILNLPAAGVTLCYDIGYQIWTVLASNEGGVQGVFACGDSLGVGATDLLLHASNGKVFAVSEDTTTDAGTSIRVEIVTTNKNWGSNRHKFTPALYLMADTVASTVLCSWSDNDFQTFSTPRSIALSSEKKMLQRCGSTKRRAWRLVHEDATPFRAWALEVEVQSGGD